jgi:2-amino-4-hydroxy-6-hydroxymethyldihydropteridine diphosphokinase
MGTSALMPVHVVIALGSNQGDSLSYLQQATAALRQIIQVNRASSVYRTAPMYVTDQPSFLNAVVTGFTDAGPRTLLKQLKAIEAEIGRRERDRYGPREIDLDLIAYGSLSYSFSGGEKELSVPHPKTVERRFVLLPLFEIAPGLKLVGLGDVASLLDQTNDQADDVLRLDDAQL